MNFDKLRELMVDKQIIPRGIKDERVISALRDIPRHKFVPDNIKEDSYDDCPLPIGHGQTISQPYIVALMTESLNLKPTDKVLEIGTGSGYQAAVLAKLCRHIYTIERIEALLDNAQAVFKELGILNISTALGDGTLGWQEHFPYEVVIVTAASPSIPARLTEQLADRGRLIIPLGAGFGQVLTLVEKKENQLLYKDICGCSFVPLVGKYGVKI